MGGELVREWLFLVVGLPMMLCWWGVVAWLGISASRGECPRMLRWIALLAVALCGLATAAYGVINASRPTWWAEAINHVLFLIVFASFMVALTSRILRKSPPRSEKERGLTLIFGFGLCFLNVAIYIATLMVPAWYNLFFLIPYSLVLFGGTLYYQKALGRMPSELK